MTMSATFQEAASPAGARAPECWCLCPSPSSPSFLIRCTAGGLKRTSTKHTIRARSRAVAANPDICNCAPQVFYHLGELDDALSYALGAGALFDLSERSEYVETILGEGLRAFKVTVSMCRVPSAELFPSP